NGTVLAGDYRIERVLGAGGFGITYLAEELALHRKVAIKEYFPGEFAARDSASQVRHRSESNKNDYAWGLERFIEEAQTLARFDHANIVRVYRYFRANNTAYMVLKFEEGQSLRQWIDTLDAPPPQVQVDAILTPVLDALELIHDHDFLHRDIAADNILLRRNGAPVLIDFGSARGEVANQTKTLSALVKPGYSPFEQYASNSKQQGPWTDIYALAATLYLVITGTRPPDAPSRLSEDEYISARSAAKARYRPGFLTALDVALRLTIAERPQSIAAWRAMLFSSIRDIHAHAPGHPAAPQATVRATRKIAGEGGEPLVWRKRVAAPTAQITSLNNAPSATPNASAGKDSVAAAFARPIKPARNVREKLSGGGAALVAGALRLSGNMKDGVDRIGRRSAAAAAQGKGRLVDGGRAIAAIRTPLRAKMQDARDAIAARNPLARPDPARERRSLVKALEEELARPIPQDNAQPKKVPPKTPGGRRALPRLPSWSGREQNDANAARAERGKKPGRRSTAKRQRAKPRARKPKRTNLGRLIFAGRMSAQLALITGFVSLLVIRPEIKLPERSTAVAAWSVSSPRASENALGLLRTFREHDAPISSLAVSDDGSKIASTSRDGRSVIWQPSTGEALQRINIGDVAVNATDIAGDQLVMAQSDGRVTLWNTRSGQRLRSFKRHKGAANAAVFTPAAKRFFSAGADERLRVWNTRRGSWRSLRGHKGAVTALAVSSNGTTLVSGGVDRTVKLWNARTRKVIKTLHAHDAAITTVAVTNDGETFASGSADESIRIYPRSGNGEIKTLYGHASTVTALAFSPSGRLLASASADHAVKLWDVGTGKLVHTFIGHTDAVAALAFMPDGRRLVTAGADKTVRIWQAEVAGF
ncbi:MAG: protein kinase, partial [Pseudomonadota bacterium]